MWRPRKEGTGLWQAWARVVGEGVLTRAVSGSGTIKQRINAVKKCVLHHMMQLASHYIRNKVLTAGWTGGISWAWLSHACEANKRWIPSITRFTLLRWAVNEDDDEWLARRGQSRKKKCALCANFGRAYPLGGYQIAICETCIVTKQLTAFTTDSLVRLLETSHRELPMQEELPASED